MGQHCEWTARWTVADGSALRLDCALDCSRYRRMSYWASEYIRQIIRASGQRQGTVGTKIKGRLDRLRHCALQAARRAR